MELHLSGTNSDCMKGTHDFRTLRQIRATPRKSPPSGGLFNVRLAAKTELDG